MGQILTKGLIYWDGLKYIIVPGTFGGPAGGDLSGTYPNPVVSALQGVAISSTAPTSAQVLSFDGTKWAPTTIVIPSATLVGDATGPIDSNSVVKIRGKILSSSLSSLGATQDGYVLSWVNGSSDWEAKPVSGSSGGAAGGDLSGNYPNPTVTFLSGAVGDTAVHVNTDSISWAAAISDPSITQDKSTAGAGAPLTILSQPAKSGGVYAGGDLDLYSGLGSLGSNSAGGAGGTINITGASGGNAQGGVGNAGGAGGAILITSGAGGNASGNGGAGAGGDIGIVLGAHGSDSHVHQLGSSSSSFYVYSNDISANVLRIGTDVSDYIKLGRTLGNSGFTASVTALTWDPKVSSPAIIQSACATDMVTTNLTVHAQDALPAAGTNTTGGNLVLQAGAGATTNGTPGNVAVSLGIPTGTGTEAEFIIERGGTTSVAIGPYGPNAGYGASYSAIWLGPSITPSSTNCTFLGNGTNHTYLSVPANGTLYLSVICNGANGVQMVTSSNTATYFQPSTDIVTALGSSTLRWTTLYAKSGVNAGTSLTGAGGAMTIQSETALSGGTYAGGDLDLYSGAGALGSSSGGGAGGAINITGAIGGDGAGASTNGGNGGAVLITSGAGGNATGSGVKGYGGNVGIILGGSGSDGRAVSSTPPNQFYVYSNYLSANLMQLQAGASDYLKIGSTTALKGITVSPTAITWDAKVTLPAIVQTACAIDLATTSLTIHAQDALPAASSNLTGGSLVLQAGSGATTNGTPGGVVAALGAPTGTGGEASFTVLRSNVFVGSIEPLPGYGASYSGLYLGPLTGGHSLNNYTIMSDGNATTRFNAPTELLFNLNNGSGGSLTFVSGDFAPGQNVSITLGDSTHRWSSLYTGKIIQAGTSIISDGYTGAHTGNATVTTIYTDTTMATNSAYDFVVTVVGVKTDDVQSVYRCNFSFTCYSSGSGDGYWVGSAPVPLNVRTSNNGSIWPGASIALIANQVLVQVAGAMENSIDWTVTFSRVRVA